MLMLLALFAAACPLDSLSNTGPLRTSAMLGHPFLRAAVTRKAPFQERFENRNHLLGNRSVWARASVKGPGIYALSFGYDRRSSFKPVCFRISGNRLSLEGPEGQIFKQDTLGFAMRPDSLYTVQALLYRKGMFLRVEGGGNSGGISMPDGLRFTPGTPGLQAEMGTVLDWETEPVGPLNAPLGAIGDSFTGGIYLGPDSLDYVSLVAAALGQPYPLNVGSGGATTADDRKRFGAEIRPFHPRLVWIESGTNDISQGFGALSIISNYAGEIGQIDWGGRVLLSTIPPQNGQSDLHRRRRDSVNAWIRHSGYMFVDRDESVRDPAQPGRLAQELDFGDGTHVNAEGHARIARAALRALESAPVGKSEQRPGMARLSLGRGPTDVLGRSVWVPFESLGRNPICNHSAKLTAAVY